VLIAELRRPIVFERVAVQARLDEVRHAEPFFFGARPEDRRVRDARPVESANSGYLPHHVGGALELHAGRSSRRK
jgi:hypothetical protein